jgi:hypothetical protein
MTRLRPLDPLDPHAALKTQIAVYIAGRPTETKATVLCGFAKANRMIASYDVIQRLFDEVWSRWSTRGIIDQ